MNMDNFKTVEVKQDMPQAKVNFRKNKIIQENYTGKLALLNNVMGQ
jgi:hypothetical protein